MPAQHPDHVALPYLDGKIDLPERATVHNPANLDEIVGYVALADRRAAKGAVQLASAAFPQWSALRATERAEYLLRAASALEAEDTLRRAQLLTREHGKALWESTLDVGGAAAILRYYASLAERFDAETEYVNAFGTARIRRRALGVTAVIVPWNYPVYLAFLMLVPALLAGNPVVVKPSEITPLALTATLTTLANALPPGVVTVVPGTGRAVGVPLIEDPRVRAVLFTGSTETGRSIMASAAAHLKRLGMELGGNDPAIVLESAVLDDQTINELVRGVYTSSGQICYSVKRIYVHERRYHDFVAAFTAAADSIVVGDGLDPASTIGPLTTQAQRAKVQAMVDKSRAEGAHVVTVGRRGTTHHWDRGTFMLPAVVTNAHPDSPLVREEQFGPAVPILRFGTDQEAVAMANSSDYGLAASVWSADSAHADAVARQIDAGSVFVNAHRIGASDLEMPFGGMKQSGLGRRHGFIAIEECSELQTIAHIQNTAGLPGPKEW